MSRWVKVYDYEVLTNDGIHTSRGTRSDANGGILTGYIYKWVTGQGYKKVDNVKISTLRKGLKAGTYRIS